MNTLIFTRGKLSTKTRPASVVACVALGASLLVMSDVARAEWKIDLSRRSQSAREADLKEGMYDGRQPASYRAGHGGSPDWAPATPSAQVASPSNKGVFDTIFESGEPIQDIVILNTEKGFVPANVRVRKNGRYKISIVNVNEREKNVSFILDGFSEHHATYYGKIKTFMLEPKKEGVFSFQSPETAVEGRIIVFNPELSLRAPASQEAVK